MDLSGIQALVFDVFGTVVDWRSNVIAEGEALGRAKGLTVDWAAFANDWRAGYHPGMDRVRRREVPWTTVDVIYRQRLDDLLVKYGISGLTEDEIATFNRVWHRLHPWADSVAGLTRLKKKFVISTLSNGTFLCLVNMAKFGGLPWDCVLTSDNVRHYKPDPETYLMVIEFLGPKPEQVMMVAAHNYDLKSAASHGMRTAFFPRPTEFGPDQTTDLEAEGDWDVIAEDMEDLADQMGA